MAYVILMEIPAEEELANLRAYDQRIIVEEIKKQLKHQPTVPSRNRKCLQGLRPEFVHDPPVWEIRVGNFRIYYDVDESSKQVHVRAIRRKSPQETTEDIT